jgi:hypothetical protein
MPVAMQLLIYMEPSQFLYYLPECCNLPEDIQQQYW